MQQPECWSLNFCNSLRKRESSLPLVCNTISITITWERLGSKTSALTEILLPTQCILHSEGTVSIVRKNLARYYKMICSKSFETGALSPTSHSYCKERCFLR